MKDLTAYFKSPSKNGMKTDDENKSKPKQNTEVSDNLLKEKQENSKLDNNMSSENSETMDSKTSDDTNVSKIDFAEPETTECDLAEVISDSQKENSSINKNESKSAKKKPGRKRKNRNSDPLVSGISELMSNGLSMISPDRGLIGNLKKSLNDKLSMYNLQTAGPTDDDITDDIIEEVQDSKKSTLESKEKVSDAKDLDTNGTPKYNVKEVANTSRSEKAKLKKSEKSEKNEDEHSLLMSPPSSKTILKATNKSSTEKPKTKRRSKLSLNSKEESSPAKEKMESSQKSNQSSLTSFFQKIPNANSPKNEKKSVNKDESVVEILVKVGINEDQNYESKEDEIGEAEDKIDIKEDEKDFEDDEIPIKEDKTELKEENTVSKGHKANIKETKTTGKEIVKSKKDSKQNKNKRVSKKKLNYDKQDEKEVIKNSGDKIKKDKDKKETSKNKTEKTTNIPGKKASNTKPQTDNSKIEEDEIKTSKNQPLITKDTESVAKHVSFSNSIEEFSPPVLKSKKKQEQSDNKKKEVFHDNEKTKRNLLATEIHPEKDTPQKTATKNAFQFMMNSRNKSIGSNSPGKEAQVEISPNTQESKEKLQSRKQKFENWANEKGGIKRKADEEDRDEIIKEKLDIRAKRLKKMLTGEESEEIAISDDTKSSKKRKRIQRLASSDSEPEDINKILINENSNDSLLITETKSEKSDVEKRPESKISEKVKLEKQTAKKIKIHPEDSQESLSLTPSSSTKRQVGLLNFFGVQNKQTSQKDKAKKKETEDDLGIVVSDEDKEEDHKEQKSLIKIKMFSPSVMSGKKRKSSKLTLKKGNDEKSLLSKLLDDNEESNDGAAKLREDGEAKKGNLDVSKKKKERSKNTEPIKIDKSENLKNNTDEEEPLQLPKAKPLKRTRRKKSKRVTKVKKPIPKLRIKLPSDDDDNYSIISDNSNFDDLDTFEEDTEIFNDDENTVVLVDIPEENSEIDGEEKDETETEGTPVRRSSRIRTPRKPYLEEEILLSDDENTRKKSNKQKIGGKELNVKVAPVFTNAAPKPKLDPAVLEARKNFLYSGVPSSLKKIMEKQQSMEEIEYEIFPMISHVNQKPSKLTPEQDYFWNLPSVKLKLKEDNDVKLPILETKLISSLNKTADVTTEVKLEPLNKLISFKNNLKEIKEENPNYPVYKSFRLLRQKCGKFYQKTQDKSKKLKRKSPKRKLKRRQKNKEVSDKSIEIIEIDIDQQKTEVNLPDFAMWTEKYKPTSSEDILGNYKNILELKKWLQNWLDCSEESSSQKSKRKRNNSSSSEFETTDGESRDSIRLPGNTLILTGPYGCGKSTAVYAICQELGINVLELNASSKRTGKRLLQELQEATQSHQVRKGDTSALSSFFQGSKTKTKSAKETVLPQDNSSNKMCLLLVEDVDIVFEQDEGFISALSQLLSTSKRPIVLVTSDTTCFHLQRFVSQYRVITFEALSPKILATWLQIVCLLEGLKVDKSAIAKTLETNRGDVRHTMLQLQFWVHSGGDSLQEIDSNISKLTSNKNQITSSKSPTRTIFKNCLTESTMDENGQKTLEEEILCADISNDSFADLDDSRKIKNDTDVYLHRNCAKHTKVYYNNSCMPHPMSLGHIWWNSPELLGFSSKGKVNGDVSISELEVLSDYYDSLSRSDLAYFQNGLNLDKGPTITNLETTVKDSVELTECFEDCKYNQDFVRDWTHTLVDGYSKIYNKDLNDGLPQSLEIGEPSSDDRRWQLKQHKCEEEFLDSLPLSTFTDRRAFALDYFPSLRNIARSENSRATISSKRNNRFYNYLRTIGIHSSESDLKTACSMLS